MKVLFWDIKYIGPKFWKSVERQVIDEWRATGYKIKAIRLYRDLTKSDLKASKMYCDDLQKRFNLK